MRQMAQPGLFSPSSPVTTLGGVPWGRASPTVSTPPRPTGHVCRTRPLHHRVRRAWSRRGKGCSRSGWGVLGGAWSGQTGGGAPRRWPWSKEAQLVDSGAGGLGGNPVPLLTCHVI